MTVRVDKTYSFTSWQASHPKDPTPGDALDTEFAEVRRAIKELSKQVDDVRRSDGSLKLDDAAIDQITQNLSNSLGEHVQRAVQATIDKALGALNSAIDLAQAAAKDATSAKQAAAKADKAVAMLDAKTSPTLAKIESAEAIALDAASKAEQANRQANALVGLSDEAKALILQAERGAYTAAEAAKTARQEASLLAETAETLKTEVLAAKKEAQDAAKQARDAARVLAENENSVLYRIAQSEQNALIAAQQAQSDRELVFSRNMETRVAGDSGESELYARCSMQWAEFIDGNNTIPSDVLAAMKVTGDHWSSRWWAHRAGELVQEGFDEIFRYYIGAYDRPPTTDPNGNALVPGAMYFNSTEQQMYVWDGDSWAPLVAPAPMDMGEYVYVAGDGQVEIGGVDITGRTPDPLDEPGCNVNLYMNGVRLTELMDFEITGPSTVTVKAPASEESVFILERSVVLNAEKLIHNHDCGIFG